MVGEMRLNNVRACVESIISDRVSGCFVECGVWRGGASIFAAAVQKANGEERDIYLCDSFRGLPMPSRVTKITDLHWLFSDVLAVSLEEVEQNIRNHHVWNDNIHLVKGWFCDTLPKLDCGAIALLRADGDMYSSTMDILTNLHHKVSPGGYVIIDDYHAIPECRRAVTEFRKRFDVETPIVEIDGIGVFWRIESNNKADCANKTKGTT